MRACFKNSEACSHHKIRELRGNILAGAPGAPGCIFSYGAYGKYDPIIS